MRRVDRESLKEREKERNRQREIDIKKVGQRQKALGQCVPLVQC